jgi:hypothetical protein
MGDGFAQHVGARGKVEPGRWRAYGHEPMGHRWADVKLKLREIAMRFGHAPEGSSPAVQDDMGPNDDATLQPKKGEGEKLRSWFCAQIRERARSVPRIEPALTNDARGLRIDSTVSIERIEPAKPVARRVDVIVFLHQGDRHPR